LDKIRGSLAAASSLQVTDQDPQYDRAAKEILANKEFLAVILKFTVREYRDMPYQAIADCIEADSISRGTAEVSPGRGKQSRVRGDNTEFGDLDEKMSRFDVLFRARNPKLSNEKVTCYLHIDIEPNRDYKPGYPIEKRGIYYMSRMIGSQLAALAGKVDYGKLEKVYSIWICQDNIPEEQRNTVSFFSFTNNWNSRDVRMNPDDHDLMSMVIVRLGNPREENEQDIIRLMNSLFCTRDKRSYEIINEYVDFSEALKTEVEKVMGIAESNFIYGKEEGREEGIEKGKTEVAVTMHKRGYPIKEIASIVGMSTEKVKEAVTL